MLTHEIVSGLLGGATPEITTYTIDQVERGSFPPAADRAYRLLTYLVELSPYLGAQLTFPKPFRTYPNDVPKKLTVQSGFRVDELFAWSDSVLPDEIAFLLNMLAGEKLIQLGSSGVFPPIVVQPAGYTRIEETRVNPASEQVFVAMWFDKSMDAPYEEGIDRGIRASGYRPLRIDRKEHLNKIDDEIIAEIRRSRFVVADFTSPTDRPRGGVYFEAGFALGLGLPVVWTCRKDAIDSVHFDTRQFNHITWDSLPSLAKQLRDRILATIGQGPLALVELSD
jgi:nucleoside 2-deoxyribosyltransferase